MLAGENGCQMDLLLNNQAMDTLYFFQQIKKTIKLYGLHKSPSTLACASLDLGHNPQLGVYKKQWVTKPFRTQSAAFKVALL